MIVRRSLLQGMAGSLLIVGPARAQQTEASDDVAVGAEDAPATLIEYASVASPPCRSFHNAVWPQLKANYIDPGLLRFVFRETDFPAPGFSAAAFQLARCGEATEETYFQRVAAMFARGNELIQFEPVIISPSGKMSGGGPNMGPLRQLGMTFGLGAAQVDACIQDNDGVHRADRILRMAYVAIDLWVFPR